MNLRLKRIQALVLLSTVVASLIAQRSALACPSGIAIGGLAAWLDFVVIKRLAAMILVRQVTKSHLVSMAFAKSLILVLVPASALLLPASVVDGVSFAIGVTMLPASIVIDTFLRAPELRAGEI